MPFELAEEEIHLWYAHFSAHSAASYAPLLSADEHTRARRFIAEEVRRRFIIGRGILRTLIGHYTRVAPQSLAFIAGERGKPSIAHPDVRFNVSHSGDLWALALTHHAEIGLDVEQICPMPEMRTIAHDNFSTQEFTQWARLSTDEQQAAFFNIWTRKEAYIKATGDGFRLPLGSFSVSHDAPPRFLQMADDNPKRWALYQAEIVPGYAGALCTTHQTANLIVRRYDTKNDLSKRTSKNA